MSTEFFKDISPVTFSGTDSTDPMSFHRYNPNEMLGDKRMEDHLRYAVAYWHSFAWEGGDPFGDQTLERPWHPQDMMERAKLKADAAFEMFRILGASYFCFHDADVRPEGSNYAEDTSRLAGMTDYFGTKMEETGTKLLWGTANAF